MGRDLPCCYEGVAIIDCYCLMATTFVPEELKMILFCGLYVEYRTAYAASTLQMVECCNVVVPSERVEYGRQNQRPALAEMLDRADNVGMLSNYDA